MSVVVVVVVWSFIHSAYKQQSLGAGVSTKQIRLQLPAESFDCDVGPTVGLVSARVVFAVWLVIGVGEKSSSPNAPAGVGGSVSM